MSGTRRTWTLDGEAYPVREARTKAVTTIAEWGLHRWGELAELVVSELVTNAVLHGRPPVELTLTADGAGRELVIEVRDASTDVPVRRVGGEDGGFGLAICSHLADLTVIPGADGKTVRARLSTGRPSRPPAGSGP